MEEEEEKEKTTGGGAPILAGEGDVSIARSKTLRAADEIPVAHTPARGWQGEMPPPVLAGCTEPLAEGAADLRGTWRAVRVEQNGELLRDHALNQHVERIEQCGDRVVVTSEPVIHDMRADGTLEHGVDDVAGANLAQKIRVAALFREGRLELYPGGVVEGRPPLVTREVIGGDLVWNYGPFKVTLQRVDGG
jgi:hypothetical protein